MNIFILGENSDIGKELAARYRRDGHSVILSSTMERHEGPWDRFISCIGTMQPIGPFFDLDMMEWAKSIHINILHQLSVFHSVWKRRRPHSDVGACFFAGGGTNGPMDNYSAYAASKLFLIKMCELLNSENPELNIFAVGPGFVKTKIHDQTIRAGRKSGSGLRKTVDFLATAGTSHDDIFDCIEWCFRQGKHVMGGRNISVIHDAWRTDGSNPLRPLSTDLYENKDMLKLRRRS